MASISKQKFADRIGRSRQRVQQLCAEGKITPNADGSLPMPEALAQWHALQGGEDDAPSRAAPPQTPQAHAEVAAVQKLNQDVRRMSLTQKAHAAKLLEFQVAEKRGLLVAKTEMVAEGQALGAALRERLLGIAPRVCLQAEAICAGPAPPRAAALKQLIDDEINSALRDLYAPEFLVDVVRRAQTP